MSSKSTGKKNSLLAKRSLPAAAPPTETTRMLAAMLDGKKRPNKRAKKTKSTSSTNTTNDGSSSLQTPQESAWSYIGRTTSQQNKPPAPSPAALFGVKKGLDMVPDILKRKKITTATGKSSASKPMKNTSKTITATTQSIKEKGTQRDIHKENNHNSKTQQQMTTTTTAKAKASLNKPESATNNTNNFETLLMRQNPYLTKTTQQPSLIKNQSKGTQPTNQTNTLARRISSSQPAPTKATISSSRESSSHPNHIVPKESKTAEDSATGTTVAAAKVLNDEPNEALPVMKLNLNNRSAAQRRKRSRSQPPPKEKEENVAANDKEKDLAVLGSMLSSSTLPPKTKQQAAVVTSKDTIATETDFIQYDPHQESVTLSKPNRLLPPMKPLLPTTSNTLSSSTDNSTKATKDKREQTNLPPRSNDNFVRLNLRNSAGACRGARNKKRKFGGKYDRFRKQHLSDYSHKQHDSDDEAFNSSQDRRPPQKETIQRAETFRAGVDPLDDYLDGVLKEPSESRGAKNRKRASKAQSVGTKQEQAPKCTRHQRPCKLLTVKKTNTGNKGRKFYACSMPRGEQCDHFQWADDTIEVSVWSAYMVFAFLVAVPTQY